MDIETSFQIILNAGDAKNYAMQAMDAADNGEFELAESLLKQGREAYNDGHRCHKKLLDQILVDEKMIEMDLMLTHALDHITSAEIILLMAEKYIHLVKEGKNK